MCSLKISGIKISWFLTSFRKPKLYRIYYNFDLKYITNNITSLFISYFDSTMNMVLVFTFVFNVLGVKCVVGHSDLF